MSSIFPRTSWLSALGLLAAAGADAKSVNPRHLDPVATPAVYVLAESYAYTEKAATFTLAPGRYAAAFEDARNVYLVGEGKCLEMHVVPPKNPAGEWSDRYECGIYLPKDSARGASFFTIRGKLPHQPEMGPVINWIIAYGEGTFLFPTSTQDDAALRSKLAREPQVDVPVADEAGNRPATGADGGATP